MTMAAMIDEVRQILMATDAPELTDAALSSAIGHALACYSFYSPHYKLVTCPTTPGEREVDISHLTDRVVLEQLEYPLGEVPRSFARFKLVGDKLALLSGPLPEGDNCRILYGAYHTLTEDASTLPPNHVHLVALGAAGYTALGLSRLAANTINIGGEGVAGHYHRWATDTLRHFHTALRLLGRHSRIREHNLYPEGSL